MPGLFVTGTAAAEAEESKTDKKNLVDDGYLFQQLAFKIQGTARHSTELFLSNVCKNLSICTEEQEQADF